MINIQTVKAIFAMLGFAALIAYAGHAHGGQMRPLHAARAVVAAHQARQARTAGMPATTATWTVASNSYRSVGR